VLVRANNGAVDHGVLVIGIGGEMLKDPLPNPGPGSAAEPPVRVLPIAKALWQIAPRNSGAVSIQNRFDESAIIAGGDADVPNFTRE
jgi:hypothetical protein